MAPEELPPSSPALYMDGIAPTSPISPTPIVSILQRHSNTAQFNSASPNPSFLATLIPAISFSAAPDRLASRKRLSDNMNPRPAKSRTSAPGPSFQTSALGQTSKSVLLEARDLII